jgi:hypothetical protein
VNEHPCAGRSILLIRAFLGSMSRTLGRALRLIPCFLGAVGRGVRGLLSAVFSRVGGLFGSMLRGASSVFGTLRSGVNSLLGSVFRGMGRVLRALFHIVTSILGGVCGVMARGFHVLRDTVVLGGVGGLTPSERRGKNQRGSQNDSDACPLCSHAPGGYTAFCWTDKGRLVQTGDRLWRDACFSSLIRRCLLKYNFRLGDNTARTEVWSKKSLSIEAVMIGGPAGSPYPGSPIALSFLCVLASLFVRARVYAKRRRDGITVPQNRVVDGIVAVCFALFTASVFWTMWINR